MAKYLLPSRMVNEKFTIMQFEDRQNRFDFGGYWDFEWGGDAERLAKPL